MRFDLDGLAVCFPYDRVYLEQYQYMRALKQTLDGGGHCLLEMPTGTGKTACLLSVVTSYQAANPECGKLVYCTRTVPEMRTVMEVMATVMSYRSEQSKLDKARNTALRQEQKHAEDHISKSNGEIVDDGEPSHTAEPRKRKRMDEPDENADDHRNGTDAPLQNGGSRGGGTLAVCLSSRSGPRVNEGVLDESDRKVIGRACRSMTASWALERARKAQVVGPPPSSQRGVSSQYFDGFWLYSEGPSSAPSAMYGLKELKRWGETENLCPYLLTLQAINRSSLLVVNYQYMLDPKMAKMISRELESESIIVFDEAHNIDRICIEAFSVTIQSQHLEQATRSLGRLSGEVGRSRTLKNNGTRLRAEYESMVNGIIDRDLLDANPDEVGLASNVLSEDVIDEAVPGNIRRAEHFVAFMKKVVEHLKARLRTVAGPAGGVKSETPLAFLHRLITSTMLEAKPLKFAYSRLSSLLQTLGVSNSDDFNALKDIADFASLVSTYSEGLPRFAIVLEPRSAGGSNPAIHLACLDSSLAIAPLFKRFGSVVITSGTLSPLDLYPKLLQFEPCVSESFNLSTFRPCIHPLVIARGSDQLPVSTKFQERCDMGVVRNYGTMMIELCHNIPDGIVAFFTSYSYMDAIISEWDGMGIMRQLTKDKLVFVETEDVVETTVTLDNFRRACDSGRGAVFLSVARGKVSEGINFDRHYGRAVIMLGVPFQYTLSPILRARLEYLQTQHQITEQDFLNFDALRYVSQCVGRVVRSKCDYGLMIFADTRYGRHDKRAKLPSWILQFLGSGQLNLSTDAAIGQVKHFLRIMAQPVDQKSLREVLLTIEEVETLVPCQSDPNVIPGDS